MGITMLTFAFLLATSLISPILASPVPSPTLSTATSAVSTNLVSNGVDHGVSNSSQPGAAANPMCSRFTCCVANFMAAPCCYMARNPECCECWERRGNRNGDPVVVIAPQEGPHGHSAVVLRTSNTNFPTSRVDGNGVDQSEDESGPFGFLSWLVQAARNRYNGNRVGPETARDNSGSTRVSTRADDIGVEFSSYSSEPKHEALVMSRGDAVEVEARSSGQQSTNGKTDGLTNGLPAIAESPPMKAEASEQVTTIVSFSPNENPAAKEQTELVTVIEAKPLDPEEDPIAPFNTPLDKTEPDVTKVDAFEESDAQAVRTDVMETDVESEPEPIAAPEPSPQADEEQRLEVVDSEAEVSKPMAIEEATTVADSDVVMADSVGEPEVVHNEEATAVEEEKLEETDLPANPEGINDEVPVDVKPEELPESEAIFAPEEREDGLEMNDELQPEVPFSVLEVIEDASPLPVEQLFKEQKIGGLKVEKKPTKDESKAATEQQTVDQKPPMQVEEKAAEKMEVKEVMKAVEAPMVMSENVEDARDVDKDSDVESQPEPEPEPSDADEKSSSRAQEAQEVSKDADKTDGTKIEMEMKKAEVAPERNAPSDEPAVAPKPENQQPTEVLNDEEGEEESKVPADFISGSEVMANSTEKVPQTELKQAEETTDKPTVAVLLNDSPKSEIGVENSDKPGDDATSASETTTEMSTTTDEPTSPTTEVASTVTSTETTSKPSTTTTSTTNTTEGLKAVPVAAVVTRRASNFDQYRRAPSFWVVIDKRRSKKQP